MPGLIDIHAPVRTNETQDIAGVLGNSMQANIQTKQRALVGNRLLDGLPARDLHEVMERSQPVNLIFADVLHVAGERIRNVYFPLRGAIGLIMSIDQDASLEVGSIGSECM